MMAESKRKVDTKPALEKDAEQERRDRLTLIIILIGAVVLVAGMIFLSKFISGS
jgi:flagellar basal body-associated protein FliL